MIIELMNKKEHVLHSSNMFRRHFDFSEYIESGERDAAD